MGEEMKLKLGHSVIAWDDNKSEALRCIFLKRDDSGYCIISEGGAIHWYKNCQLDPDATEFLPGDEVEVSDHEEVLSIGKGANAVYIGYNQLNNTHVALCDIDNGQISEWRLCRYPQQKSKETLHDFKSKFKEIHDRYMKDIDSLANMSLDELDEGYKKGRVR